ncbi:MAG TPA: QueT transporter family protein [Haloplasmataceae bacterium]
MKIKLIALNGVFAALYVTITAFIQPIAFSNLQFRIPEIFNHLVVYNKKYFFGIVIGVFISNYFFSTLLPYDLFFGVAHSIISLLITIIISRFVHNKWVLMIINSFVFSVNMFIIAYELNLVLGFPFFETWALTALGELGVMFLGMPVISFINNRISL